MVAIKGKKSASTNKELKIPKMKPPMGDAKKRIPTTKLPANVNKSARPSLLGGGGGGNLKVMWTDVVVATVEIA